MRQTERPDSDEPRSNGVGPGCERVVLSTHDQRALIALEAQLWAQQPDLAALLADQAPAERTRRWPFGRRRR